MRELGLRTMVAVACFAPLVSCAAPQMRRPATVDLQRLFHRAHYDMDCNRLKVEWIDEVTRGVAGCGKRMTYVMSCPDAVTNRDNLRPGENVSFTYDPTYSPQACLWAPEFATQRSPERLEHRR